MRALVSGPVHTPANPRARIWLALLVSLAAAFAVAAWHASPASALACTSNAGAPGPLAGSNFEAADGNMCDPNDVWRSGLDDWQTAVTTSIADADNSDTIFGPADTGSSQEQVPDTWGMTRGNVGGPKFNLQATWTQPDPNPLLCQTVQCDLFLYLGFIREATSGSTDLAFELNHKQPGYRQSPAVANPNSTPPTTVGEFGVPTRSEGDALITYDIAGNVVTVGMCLWHGDEHSGKWKLLDGDNSNLADNVDADSTNDKICTPINTVGGTAQGALNENDIPAAQNFFTAKPGDLTAGQFGEAGVNVTDTLQGNQAAPPCVNFGSAWAHSRSSDAITSDQKDWVTPQPVVIASCPTVTIKKETLPDEPNNTSTFGYTSTLPSGSDGSGTHDRSFSLHDDGSEGPVSAPAGSYTVSESNVPSGYHVDHVDCTDPTNTQGGQNNTGANDPNNPGVVTINASGTEAITCTYYNAKDSSLTIAKDATPDSSTPFSFSASGSGITAPGDQAFSLFDDGTDPNGSEHTKKLNFQAGQFGTGQEKVIHETPASGWKLDGISCPGATVSFSSTGNANDYHSTFTAGDTYAKVTIGPGQDIVCTYSNTQQATVKIVKQQIGGSTSDAFSFTPGGGLLTGATPSIALSNGHWSLTDNNLGSASNQDATNTQTISNVAPNGSGSAYTVAEDSPNTNGYRLTDITCDNPVNGNASDNPAADPAGLTSGSVDIHVDPGETVTCVFTNTKNATVKVVKQQIGGSTSDAFSFTPGGGLLTGATPSIALSNGHWSLTDNNLGSASNQDATNTQTISNVIPNGGGSAYTVAEDSPNTGGYRLTDITCDNPVNGNASDNPAANSAGLGSGSADVHVDPGETVTCVYTNTKDAIVKVVKQQVGGSTSDAFSFTPGGTLVSSSGTPSIPLAGGKFSLTDGDLGSNSNQGAGNTETFPNVIPNGSGSAYTVAEDSPNTGGYRLTDISCDNPVNGNASSDPSPNSGGLGSGSADIHVDPGETVTCVYTNTKNATVKVVKQQIGGATSGSFSFTPGGGLLTGATPSIALSNGHWSLTDNNLGSTSNQDATNTQTISNVVPNGSGSAYTVAEDSPNTGGYRLTDITCDNPVNGNASDDPAANGAGLNSGSVNVHVDPGETVTCVYTNTANASVRIIKQQVGGTSGDPFSFTPGATLVSNSNPTPALSNGKFSLTDGDLGSNSNEGPGNTQTFADVTPNGAGGAYTVAEDNPNTGGYRLTDISCDNPVNGNPSDNPAADPNGLGSGSADIHVDPGETVTCVFTNTKNATVNIRKVNVGGDPQDTFAFNPSAALDSGPDFTLKGNGVPADDTKTYTNVLPDSSGAYSVAEQAATGYRLTDITCDDQGSAHASSDPTADAAGLGSRVATINADPGETVTCTFTNTVVNSNDMTVKSGPEFAYHGDSVTYNYAVTNTGDGPLFHGDPANPDPGPVLTDDKCSPVTGPLTKLHPTQADPNAPDNSTGSFDPGDKWTYSCTTTISSTHQDGEEDPIVNTVTAHAFDEFGRPVDSSANHSTNILHPAIAIDKTGPARATEGDLLAYTLTVTDPGETSFPAANVVVTDPNCVAPPVLQTKNRGAGLDPTPGTLDPGDSWVYTCSGQTAKGQTEFVNVARVDGTDENGRSVNASDTFTTVLAQQVVAGTRVEPGTARIAGKSGCVARAFYISVKGTQIKQVVFRIDGKKRATLNAPDSKGRYKIKVDPRKFRPGSHLAVAKAIFTAESNTKTKTLKVRFARCVRRTAPAFTG